MCGIGGIVRVWPAGAEVPPPEVSIPEGWLDVLDESIRHRGPDGAGRFRDRAVRGDGMVVDVALVHRRLSIIDHAGGRQPMVSERGREGKGEGLVAVVFNGCIYNHRELRRELEGAGHRFVTDHSDTEVLVHGWREWGEDLPRRLDGMFALAIWDRERGGVFFARDLAGEKPLYEAVNDRAGVCIFGSTLPAVLRGLLATGFDRAAEVTDLMLGEWVRYGCGNRPPMTWIREVEPRGRRIFGACGGGAVIDEGEPLPERSAGGVISAGELDDLLSRAVASRLEADVPLGCFLSGGVDSSLIAQYARRAAGRLATFTVAMPDPRYDESRYAEQVARLIGTDHLTLRCEPRPAEDLVALIEQIGLPFGDSSLLPAYWVSRAARQHAAVCLGGDGGDELFGGYERHVINPAFNRFRALLAAAPVLTRERHPKSRSAKLARLMRAARHGGYSDLRSIFPVEVFDRLGLGAGPRRDRGERGDDPLRDDFVKYLPEDLLRKTDAASMAVGLEVRSPLLSRSVVSAALRAPLSCLMPRGKRKGLLRQVARKYLPAEVVDRPKMGFAIPVSEWFRTDYGGMKTLLMDRLRSVEPFGPPSLGIEPDMKFVEKMVEEHMSRRRDHGQRLYMLLVLSIWAGWVGREMAKGPH